MKETINFSVKDYSVSGEEFVLKPNETFGYLETFPQPDSSKLGDYYKSEDYISHTNSKRNLFEKVYHQVRVLSLKRKLKLINSFKSTEKKILDIGCGTGSFLSLAEKNNWKITGIEPNESARKIANEVTNGSVYDISELLKLKKESFDVITLWHVLEHLPNLEEHLSLIKKLLKPSGTVIVAVPNYKSFDAGFYKKHWAAYDVPRHLWHFSQVSMKKLFQKKQMTVFKTLPMRFDAFYVSLLSEKYKTKSMRPIHAFFIGFYSNIKALRTSEYSSLIYLIKKE